jgi:hypothetical protein
MHSNRNHVTVTPAKMRVEICVFRHSMILASEHKEIHTINYERGDEETKNGCKHG